MNPEEFPSSARRAFEQYPQIEPSLAFNRAVLDSLQAAQDARQLTFIGRIEEFLGLKWWQFAASGLLGALFPAIVLGVLLSKRSAAPTEQTPTNPFIPRSIGPLYARELWREELRDMQPRRAPSPNQPQRNQGEELSCVETHSPLV